jgi:N-acyl-L-homoserine lactone synthetase
MSVAWGKRETLPATLLEASAAYRHAVFVQALGWDLTSRDGQEQDQYDGPDAIYGIALDERSNITGFARLLPTTRPYLLADVFPQLLDGAAPPRSETIWEVSRFASVELSAGKEPCGGQFSAPRTRELVQSTLACAARLGAEQLISVSPFGIARLLRAFGVEARAGQAHRVDGRVLVACRIDVGLSQRAPGGLAA